MRQDAEVPGAQLLAEGAPDAVEHRVATGEYGDAEPLVRGQQTGYGGPERRGPGLPLSCALRRQQLQLPCTADQHLGAEQCRA